MFPLDRTTVTCVLLTVLASAHLEAVAEAKGHKKKERAAEAAAAEAGWQHFLVAGVRETSGIALHPKLHHLFVVGDEGTVGELDQDGRTVRADVVPGNLEDLAFHPESGTFLVISEKHARLLVYDPIAHQEKRRIALETEALLGQAPEVRPGQGFEGLAFRPEPGRAGGGVFYLAHQRSPAIVVAVAFDPMRADTIGKGDVVGRWGMAGRYQHLTAISYEPSLGRFLLIADRRLVVLRTDGTTESESAPLPFPHPEGACLDEHGAVWIADDPTGLDRFAGGLKALTVSRAGGTTP